MHQSARSVFEKCQPRVRRRGGVYVLVLVVTTFASGMALLGLRVAMTQHTEGTRVGDSITARQHAASAFEAGLHSIVNEPDWRTARSSGKWLDGEDFRSGTVDVAVEAVGGGSYSASAADPVQVTAYGYEGSSRSILRAQVALSGTASRDHIGLLYAKSALAYWPIDGTEGGGYEVDDVDGNDLVKEWTGSQVLPGAVPGLGAGTAAWFGGTAGSMEAASQSTYDDIRTVSVWFWVPATTGFKGIVTRDASGRGSGGLWELSINNGALEGIFDTSTRTVTLSGGTVPTGQWNHAVLTVADDQMRLYLNGVQVDQWSSMLLAGELAGCAPTQTIRVGVSRRLRTETDVGTNPINGGVCELAILGEPMSDAEVLALYEAYPQPATYAVVTDTWERVIE